MRRMISFLVTLCFCVGHLSITASAKTELPFSDVKESDWYYESVVYVYQNDLFSGTSATEFSPTRPMDRAMIAVVLYRLAGKPSITSYTVFDDLEYDAYYYNAVIWADARGIINGTGERIFSPQESITQEQMAVMLYRYAVLYGGIEGTSFVNLNDFNGGNLVGTYAKKAVSWCLSNGLIYNSNPLKPKEAVTRADVADMLFRLSRLQKNGGTGYKQTIEPLVADTGISCNRSSYYDIDADGQEELLITFEAGESLYQVASVYTIKNGQVAPIMLEEKLYPVAGGPSGAVGVVETGGMVYVCLLNESGETDPEERVRAGTYKFYRLLDDYTLEEEMSASYDFLYRNSQPVPAKSSAALMANGQTQHMTYNEFKVWEDSLHWESKMFLFG